MNEGEWTSVQTADVAALAQEVTVLRERVEAQKRMIENAWDYNATLRYEADALRAHRDILRIAAEKARDALSELLMTRDPKVYADALRALADRLLADLPKRSVARGILARRRKRRPGGRRMQDDVPVSQGGDGAAGRVMSAQVLAMQPRPSRLADLEQVVERGQRSFVEVGKALRTIRDERLYDAAFGTFEAYCQARFGMGRNYPNKIIAATDTVERLGTNVPITEGAIRPLTKLEPDEQRKVWSEATARWRKPTAAQVSEVIGEMFPKAAPKSAQLAEPTGPTSRLVLVLDDLDEVAKVLSTCMELAKVERLHELLGQRLEKRRAVWSPNAAGKAPAR